MKPCLIDRQGRPIAFFSGMNAYVSTMRQFSPCMRPSSFVVIEHFGATSRHFLKELGGTS